MSKRLLGTNDDSYSFERDGLKLHVKRLPSGKWSMTVVGEVEMIFDQRPAFTVPK